MRTAFVISNGVDLIDNHRFNIAEQFAAALGGEQNVERFRRGDQDVRRRFQHPLSIRRGRIAGPDEGPNLRHQVAVLAG